MKSIRPGRSPCPKEKKPTPIFMFPARARAKSRERKCDEERKKNSFLPFARRPLARQPSDDPVVIVELL